MFTNVRFRCAWKKWDRFSGFEKAPEGKTDKNDNSVSGFADVPEGDTDKKDYQEVFELNGHQV